MIRAISASIAIVIMAASCSAASQDDKTLVAYFSATGTTEEVARRIAEATEADLFEITPETTYTEADLNWRDKSSRSSLEMADKSSRPAVKTKIRNIGQYSTIYIGYPIWWGIAPTIVNTFIEENDLSGKAVRLFATSGGSTIDSSCEELAKTYPSINWQGGQLLNDPSDDEIEWFINGEDAPGSYRLLCGGFTEQREPTEEEIEMFRKAVKALSTNDVYTPLSVSTQVVAGLNYRFWCRVETEKGSGHCSVTIYKPLPGQGEPKVTKIETE